MCGVNIMSVVAESRKEKKFKLTKRVVTVLVFIGLYVLLNYLVNIGIIPPENILFQAMGAIIVIVIIFS